MLFPNSVCPVVCLDIATCMRAALGAPLRARCQRLHTTWPSYDAASIRYYKNALNCPHAMLPGLPNRLLLHQPGAAALCGVVRDPDSSTDPTQVSASRLLLHLWA